VITCPSIGENPPSQRADQGKDQLILLKEGSGGKEGASVVGTPNTRKKKKIGKKNIIRNSKGPGRLAAIQAASQGKKDREVKLLHSLNTHERRKRP